MSHERELSAALDAVQAAQRIILEHYQRFEAIADAPASITTAADRDAQEAILKHLHQAFPDDALCAEETTDSLKEAKLSGPRLWIVDPIDGTRGFARKNGEFSVMVGLVEDGKIAVGIVAEPARNRLTYATLGGGCWRRDDGEATMTRCQATVTEKLAEATLTQSRSKRLNEPSRYVQALKPAQVVETYSAGIKLALVARGEADVYLNTYDQFHDWDICAGQILVDEAGGKVSDLAGNDLVYGTPGAWQRNGLLASNGRVHEAALAVMKMW